MELKLRNNVFDGETLWVYHVGHSVDEHTIGAIADRVRHQSPNVTGLMIKVADGHRMMGYYDQGPDELKINSPDDIARWVGELGMRDLSTHLWVVPTGDEIRNAAIMYAVCANVDNVRSLTLDVEHGQGYWNNAGRRRGDDADGLGTILRAYTDRHIGLCSDFRKVYGTFKANELQLDRWLPHVDSLHPMCYWHHFSEGTRGPDNQVDGIRAVCNAALEWLYTHAEVPGGMPVVPMIQTYATPLASGQNLPVPPQEIRDALFEAHLVGNCATLFRYGRSCSSDAIMKAMSVMRMPPFARPTMRVEAPEEPAVDLDMAETWVKVRGLIDAYFRR